MSAAHRQAALADAGTAAAVSAATAAAAARGPAQDLAPRASSRSPRSS